MRADTGVIVSLTFLAKDFKDTYVSLPFPTVHTLLISRVTEGVGVGSFPQSGQGRTVTKGLSHLCVCPVSIG